MKLWKLKTQNIMELFCSSKYYDGIHSPCLQHSPRAHIKHKQTYKNIILRWAILITDRLMIAHLKIAPQWAILRWAFLTFTMGLPPPTRWSTQSSVWREAYFNSRDGNENFFLSISCSRREREFLSFNLMFETGTRISFSQSRASRREREFHFSISGFETRTRIEIETILARIFGNYIFCFFIDWYFQKKGGYFSKFLEIICPFFSRNLNENLNFRDENGNFFHQSRVSRREREYFFINLAFRDENEK